MKKIIRTVLCFVIFLILSNEKVKALVPMPEIKKDINTNVFSTVTPTTAILVKPIKDFDIDIKPLSTNTPTPVITIPVVTITPNQTVTEAQAKPTETEKIIVTPDTTVTVVAEPTIEEIKITEEKTDLNNWFWIIIIGLLALILLVQIWSTRKNEQEQNNKENK
jgi:choline-glycine betaine transporter